MIRSLTDFISSITGGEESSEFDADDYRLSAAALLVHVAASDDSFDHAERAVLHDALTQRFEVGPGILHQGLGHLVFLRETRFDDNFSQAFSRRLRHRRGLVGLLGGDHAPGNQDLTKLFS